MGFVYIRGERRELNNTRAVDLVLPEWNITILDTKLGEGVVIWSNLNVYGAEIGRRTKLASFVEIQRGVRIGKNSKISSFIMIPTGVEIGKCVFVGPQAVFTNDVHPAACGEDGMREDDFELTKTVIRDYASIGAGVVILAGITIGRHALVGAGSTVADNVGECEVWYGGKARMRGASI